MTKINLYPQEGAEVKSPKFFPDGENIAFLWDIGNDRGDFDLYVGDIHGTEPVLLIDDLFLYAISPNGDEIAFVRETSRSTFNIFLFDFETMVVDQLTQDGRYKTELQWSPNGERIAYYVDEDSLGLINFNINDEAVSKVLFEGNVYDYGISWAPNNMIAFPYYSDELLHISVMDIDTAEPLIFTSPDGMCIDPVFIPMRNQVISNCRVSGSWNVFLLDIDSGEYSQLTNFENASKEYTILRSSLLFKDDYILFSYWEGEPTDDVLDLYIVSLDGSGLTQLTEGLNIEFFDWFQEEE
jgi:Tol biopolymer transport system component